MDELDKELELRGYSYVRYADDVKIFAKSEWQASRIMKRITDYIEEKLKLKVNRNKSRVCRSYELTFLGHRIFLDGTLGLGEGSVKGCNERLACILSRSKDAEENGTDRWMFTQATKMLPFKTMQTKHRHCTVSMQGRSGKNVGMAACTIG